MQSQFKQQMRAGLEVWSSDSEKLGRVVGVTADSFIVENGIFFPKDYILAFDDVREIRGDEVQLSRTRKELGTDASFWDTLVGRTGEDDHPHVGRFAGEIEQEPEEAPISRTMRRDLVERPEVVDVPRRKMG